MGARRATAVFIAGVALRLGSRTTARSPAPFSPRQAPPPAHSASRRARPVCTASSAAPPADVMAPALDTDCVAPVLRPGLGGGIDVVAGPGLLELEADLLVIGVRAAAPGAEWALPADVAAFDAKVAGGAIADAAADAEFAGKAGSSTEVVRVAGAAVRRVVLYGLGEGKPDAAGKAAEFAVSKGKGAVSVKSAALYLDGGPAGAEAVVAEGASVAVYSDQRYKGKPKEQAPPERLVLSGAGPGLAAHVARGQAVAAGVLATKDVVAAPANSLTPEALAGAARLVAKEAGLEIKVLGRKECKELKMGCFLGVTQGSLREPQFIHMTYKPEGAALAKVALVGKAVTFDSGGYNIKAGSGSMIELMKWDMGGSGAVLGAAAAIGRLKPSGVEVHFIMPACENMISDRAIHPGDILTASNGKTVEVLNTDAEGRLCLADALVYAENLGVDSILDIATLTGAIITSLGHDVAGFWTPNDYLAADLVACGAKSGEKLWRMPIVESYGEQLKSKIADLRNIGTGRAGSSIIAAMFLQEFVTLDKWSHIDIAGTAWSNKESRATSFGVKTMVNFVENISNAMKGL